MATSTSTQQRISRSAAIGTGSGVGHDPAASAPAPAATAAARVSRAGLALGGLGLASAIIVLSRLFLTWRVSSHAANRVSIFGLKLSYPAANLDAIVVMILAALGALVTARAVYGGLRELRASRRLQRYLAGQALVPLHGALVIDDAQPRAFCAGFVRPRVYLSTGAVDILDEDALRAVLAHEAHHAHRHDPLRLAAGRVLAGALFFVPALGDLVERQQALAELSADESAMRAAPDNRSALARAMLSFSDAPDSAGSTGIDPARVDYLLGEPPSWRFPALLCMAGAAVIILLAAIALLAARLASGSATLALPFISHQPCIVVLATIPAVLGSLAMLLRRRLGRSS